MPMSSAVADPVAQQRWPQFRFLTVESRVREQNLWQGHMLCSLAGVRRYITCILQLELRPLSAAPDFLFRSPVSFYIQSLPSLSCRLPVLCPLTSLRRPAGCHPTPCHSSAHCSPPTPPAQSAVSLFFFPPDCVSRHPGVDAKLCLLRQSPFSCLIRA